MSIEAWFVIGMVVYSIAYTIGGLLGFLYGAFCT